MLSQTPQWVAVYTNPRAEKKVYSRLVDQGFEVFLPLVKERRKWSDRYKIVEIPLFSSYVFAKICRTDVAPLRETLGVSFLVSFLGVVETIPEQQIDAVRRLVNANQRLYVEQMQRMRKGAHVRIIEGAFAGMEGELISDNKNGNFAVKIHALQLSLVTHIDRLMLQIE